MPYSGTAPHAAVVGPGRVGRALASFGAAHFQAPSRLIGRGEQVPDDHQVIARPPAAPSPPFCACVSLAAPPTPCLRPSVHTHCQPADYIASQGPIFVATQNDALEDVILQTPRVRPPLAPRSALHGCGFPLHCFELF